MKKGMLIIIFSIFITTAGFSEIYKFESGEYYLLDGRVNVRSAPNLTGKVIGKLEINSKINIIECAFNEQTINDVPAYWYKIKYDNSNGYIWGGYIAVETLVCDIDKNGIDDFFHYRRSKSDGKWGDRPAINGNSDIFCYLNGKLIPFKFVFNYSDNNTYIFHLCFFTYGKDAYGNNSNCVHIYTRSLNFMGYGEFIISPDGKIVLGSGYV